MNSLSTKTSGFRLKFEKFILGCESVDEMNLWDTAAYGEMDAFYSNELTLTVLRFIAADGIVSQTEADFLNTLLGFDYRVDELTALCRDFQENIDCYINEYLDNGLTLLRGINQKLAAAYVELLLLVCDIIISSDGVIEKAEIHAARHLMEILQP